MEHIMKNLLNRLFNHEILSKEEAKNTLINISNGTYNQNQIASFLTVYMMRSIHVDELSGFREALLELCIKVDLSDYNTFNISTLAAFVTAGAGIKVAKHGNYGVSSISGSSTVMEKIGVQFSNKPHYLKKCVDQAGICILHAPLFHPAMKNVAPIRKELGVKTFFNIVGPMVNPSFPKNQLVGVYSLELARIYAYLYQNTAVNYNIVHSLDGYDEISLTYSTKSISKNSEIIFSAVDLGISKTNQIDIMGGKNINESAQIFMKILSGKGTEAQNNVVCANAGMAISTINNTSLIKGFELAKESLLSGKGLTALEKLKKVI